MRINILPQSLLNQTGRIEIGYGTYGENLYKVLEVKNDFYLIECVEFYKVEDTGDNIFCQKLSQKLWVAHLNNRWQESMTLQEYLSC